jgi:hypothetical protein
MDDLIRLVMNGTLREQYLLLVGAAGAVALMTGLLGAWIGAYFGGRRGARREIAQMEQRPAVLVEAQLADLRQAVEHMALEMERVAEGQRFTARMLVERVTASPPANHRREAGSVTPH